MATGFIESVLQGKLAKPDSSRSLRCFALVFAILALTPAGLMAATAVTVVGLFPGKAVVVIGNQSPRTLSVGQKTPEGITLLSTAADKATFEIDGKRVTLDVGQHFAPPRAASIGQSVSLTADSGGHFYSMGQINGRTVRFLVDTGATAITISTSFAQSAGIDYRKGLAMQTQTANGIADAYKVVLDQATVGEITLYQVEAVVMDGMGAGVALLGMSFLNRMEMRRDGASMVLTKRY